MSRHMPRWLKLKKNDEKRIVQILSGLWRTAPEITVTPYTGETFDVELDEAEDCYVSLAVGQESFFAEYDGYARYRMEATHQKVTRKLRACGLRCFEVRFTRGAFYDRDFEILWPGWPFYYHVTKTHTYTFNESGAGTRFPRRLAMRNEIRWTDEYAAQGPDEALALVAGFCRVCVGGRELECVQTLTLQPYTVDPEEDAGKELPKWIWLDIRYISRRGRTVLIRTFCTSAYYESWGSSDDEDIEWPGSRTKITYNGVDFFHWYDTITDVALGEPNGA